MIYTEFKEANKEVLMKFTIALLLLYVLSLYVGYEVLNKISDSVQKQMVIIGE